jgi:hypothetical protein
MDVVFEYLGFTEYIEHDQLNSYMIHLPDKRAGTVGYITYRLVSNIFYGLQSTMNAEDPHGSTYYAVASRRRAGRRSR